MVVCRFFQQGNCRYGSSCRFEHVSTVSPLLRQNVQPTANVPPPRNAQSNNPFRGNVKKDANDIFNLMVQDINEAEKGGVWPLSCYNFWPAISTGNVPGLEDISPDEMRHMQLQAQLGGSIEACNQQIQLLYQQARARFNSLKVRSAETLSTIESMTRGPSSPPSQFSFAAGNNSVVQDSWPAPSATQSSIFGGSSATASTEASKSIFGGSLGFGSSQGSVFSSNQGSVFGSGNAQPSVFGGASPQNSVFGGSAQQPTSPSFGAVAQQTSIFGNSTQVQQSSPFGSAPVQQGSPFVNAAATQQASPFGAPASAGHSGGSIFGGASASAAAQPSSFSFALPNALEAGSNATQIASSPFGAPAVTLNNSGSIFGGAATGNSSQTGGSIFGGFAPQPQPQPQKVVSSVPVVLNSTIYSAIAQLPEEERREFEAETFTMGKIPTRPPPRELC